MHLQRYDCPYLVFSNTIIAISADGVVVDDFSTNCFTYRLCIDDFEVVYESLQVGDDEVELQRQSLVFCFLHLKGNKVIQHLIRVFRSLNKTGHHLTVLF